MLDKLVLTTKDFEIMKEAPLKIESSSYDFSSGELLNNGLLFTCNRQEHFGKKAYYNEELFNLDINNNGLRLVFSPTKVFFNGDNFNVNSMDIDKVKQACSYVGDRLSQNGIMLNIDSMAISRLDLARDIETKKGFFEYKCLFNSLSAKRMKVIDYGETYSFRNKSREVCLYDKIFEAQKRDIKYKDYKKNIIRAELRLRNKRTVFNNIGRTYARELYNDYEELLQVYKQTVSEVVFRRNSELSGEQLYLDFDKEVELLKYLREKRQRGVIKEYLSLVGVETLLMKFNDLDTFKRVLIKAGFDRSTAYRHCMDIQKYIQLRASFYKEYEEEQNNIIALYEELYSKLTA